MLSTTPHEYFNHLNLMAFDSGSAQYVKDEIQSFENIDLLNGSDVMDELNDLIATNFPDALKDIEKPAPEAKPEKPTAIYSSRSAAADEPRIKEGQTVWIEGTNQKAIVDHIIEETRMADGKKEYMYVLKDMDGKRMKAYSDNDLHLIPQEAAKPEEKKYFEPSREQANDLSIETSIATAKENMSEPEPKKSFTKAQINGAISQLERIAKYKTGDEKQNYASAIKTLKTQVKYALMAKGGPVAGLHLSDEENTY